jgi:metallo-beta-lactamase family protein
MKISFLGAARHVAGSRFLVEESGVKILIDCGLFQGQREWKERNWAEFPVNPSSINAVILTHAHIDHSGYLPRLVKMGFHGPVYCTPATKELLGLMLPDSAHLQEEDARYANREKYTRHDPALPLYTLDDVNRALQQLRPLDFYKPQELTPGLSFSYLRAGHILGSAMVQLVHGADTVLFSGDVGRPSQFITKKPDDIQSADTLVLESTYGDRLHQRIDVLQRLKDIVKRTTSVGGTLLVPAFAIGRTQELLYLLRLLEERHEVPQVPVYIDSPMAIHALPIYDHNHVDFSKDLETLSRKDPTPFICHHIRALQTVQESMTLNEVTYPCIIISSSGMATGGRILHHLKRRVSDHRNTVLFIGYQAEGTKGRTLVDGAKEVKIHGQSFPVRAQIEYMDALSCHADYEEMLDWLTSIKKAPRMVYLVHGEEQASLSLAQKIKDRFGWNTHVPQYLESVEL